MKMLMNIIQGSSTSQRILASNMGVGRNEPGVRGEGRIDSRHEALDNTYLDFSPQDDICITRISETKNSAKLLRSEITDVANFEFGGLAHDRMTVISR
jgi:hypothetical protein